MFYTQRILYHLNSYLNITCTQKPNMDKTPSVESFQIIRHNAPITAIGQEGNLISSRASIICTF